MKRVALIFTIVAACAPGALGQTGDVAFQASGGVVMARAIGGAPVAPVTGAPYSATMTTEMVQTLSDGTHITQTMTGTVARDSQGRTRQDAPLPTLGNLSAANAPHLVFLQDPVAQASYTLNLTNKTAQKMPALPPPPSPGASSVSANGQFFIQQGAGQMVTGATTGGSALPLPPSPAAVGPGPVIFQKTIVGDGEFANATTEDLGTETMQGITVTGTRTTRTIPQGQIGNDAPITTVTEVWTSPDLKTVVYSKRTDPRLGEQTFQLTNISRAEPDPSLFTVPADFTLSDGPQLIQYQDNPPKQ